VIFEGVIGLTKDRLFPGSLEYFIGDGTHKYSELPKYGGAEASILSKAYTLVLRGADGKIDSDSLREATSTTIGAVKASTDKAGDNVVKADADGSLDGWKDAISDAVASPDNGLVKNADGTLGVDFNRMPTDKFEELLKSLKMLIPLSTTLNLYVDKNSAASGDTIIDGRGTLALPFKTIQAAINYVTSTYALGPYSVNIYIAQATYNENLRCPEYSRTTGQITLCAYDDANPPTIKNVGTVSSSITVEGGTWFFRRLTIDTTVQDPDNGITNTVGALIITNSSSSVVLQGCSLSIEYIGNAPSSGIVELRLISIAANGSLRISALEGYQTSLTCNKGNASRAFLIRVERYGTFNIMGGNAPEVGNMYKVVCNGAVDTVVSVTLKASVISFGGLLYSQTFIGSITGKKYDVSTGASITAPPGGFPGDVDGSVESETFSWYK